MIKILFICHGNICRSPMAEFIFKKMVKDAGLEKDYVIASAATSREEIGNDIYPPAKRELTKRGVPFERRGARQVTREEYKDWDMFICMDEQNVRNIMRIFGSDPEKKVSMLLDRSVADPWYTDNFGAAFDDIYRGCIRLFSYKQHT
ncbi:MAG: low molecular weight phosphotyrosine protein phosphatase [Parasporobacterium sp.]|nr:low molecular weight phosphotyrosine protein phosphatase [Parasporobacterium sp.]